MIRSDAEIEDPTGYPRLGLIPSIFLNTERLVLKQRDRYANQAERRVRQQLFRSATSGVTPRYHACVTVATFHVTT